MKSTRQTAYSNDCASRSEGSDALPGWDRKIAELYGLGHQFLPFEYSESGYLYRGGASGLSDLLHSGVVGHFKGDQSFVRLEQELDIYLVSQDFSDAYSVARFWEGSRGGYIAVFKSACFKRELQAGRAAMLGFAEPGVVFKYPFTTRPLQLCELECLIVSPDDHAELGKTAGYGSSVQNGITDKIISPEIGRDRACSRRDYEYALNALLAARGIESAVAIPSKKVPRRK